jgi:hypothetical protein
MQIKDQIPEIDQQKASIEGRINFCTGQIMDVESQIAVLEKRRLYLVERRRRLGVELARVSTFKLDL